MSNLVRKILAGNSQAVIDFYNSYSPKIFRYLKKELPREEDAQEITNDVFFDAIDSLSLLKSEENILAWLYKIAKNKRADYYRKKRIKGILLSHIPFLEIVSAEIHQPEFQFEKDRIRDKIEESMHSLSEEYQNILRLHYEEKIPVKDIAILFDMSFKATESLLYRARQSFKKAYERA